MSARSPAANRFRHRFRDEESLNQAVKALEGLADGNCLVGIISHVPKLKERIEKKIIVTKNRSRDGVGSRAVVE